MRTGWSAVALIVLMAIGISICSCSVPRRWLVGVYYSDMGDSLRLNPNYSFRIEMMNPDTVTKKQLKFSSGRWYKKRNKVFFSVAAKAMGEYWQCVPMKASWHHLRRPVDCEGESAAAAGSADRRGPSMDFRKVHLKRKKHSAEGEDRERKKKKKGEDQP
jgi:hypothetical protein